MTKKPGAPRNRSRTGPPNRRPKVPLGGKTARPSARQEGLPLLGGRSVYLYGRNSVRAALENPERQNRRLYMADNRKLGDLEMAAGHDTIIEIRHVPAGVLEETFPEGTPHQGFVLETSQLPEPDLIALAEQDGPALIVMLDQVTDPQNVGACLRTAAALGATALITQDRHSPPETGALARAAAGGLETLPWCRVSNLAKTIEALRDHQYWSVGLDGAGDLSVSEVPPSEKVLVVMGSEGRGLRPLVAQTCDTLASIPMTDRVESLNVSVATALAVQALRPPGVLPV